VNPNARCPVCNERVYYYQNAYGSRVFFNDLGWPWPKHECTDNSEPSSQGRGSYHYPSEVRDQHTSRLLLQAAHHQKIVFNRTRNSNGWLLGILIKVETFDGTTDARVSFLEEDRPPGRFQYAGTSPFLKRDAIISYKGDAVSLPDHNLERTTIRVKWLA
jgi:hypothetical protein